MGNVKRVSCLCSTLKKQYDELVDELLSEGWTVEDAEQAAFEEFFATTPVRKHGYITPYID